MYFVCNASCWRCHFNACTWAHSYPKVPFKYLLLVYMCARVQMMSSFSQTCVFVVYTETHGSNTHECFLQELNFSYTSKFRMCCFPIHSLLFLRKPIHFPGRHLQVSVHFVVLSLVLRLCCPTILPSSFPPGRVMMKAVPL